MTAQKNDGGNLTSLGIAISLSMLAIVIAITAAKSSITNAIDRNTDAMTTQSGGPHNETDE